MNQYINFISNTMNYANLSKNAIADNIANYNTPNYKTKEIVGRPVFQLYDDNESKWKMTHPKHISLNKDQEDINVVTRQGTKERFDGNNVDLNIQMIEAMKNNSLFKYSVEAINKEMTLHRIVLGRG